MRERAKSEFSVRTRSRITKYENKILLSIIGNRICLCNSMYMLHPSQSTIEINVMQIQKLTVQINKIFKEFKIRVLA